MMPFENAKRNITGEKPGGCYHVQILLQTRMKMSLYKTTLHAVRLLNLNLFLKYFNIKYILSFNHS